MKHKPKYFYRLFLPFVLIGTLVMIAFNGVAYILTKDKLDEKISLEKLENVVQTKNTLEQKIQTLDYALNSYIYDNPFKQYMELPLTASNFDTYREIIKRLNYISAFGPSQTSIELVSLKGNWVINKEGLKQLTHKQKEEVKSKYIELANTSTWVVEEDNKKEILLVKKTPFNLKESNGILIVHIPLNSFSNLIYKQSDSNPIFIYNQEGKFIYQSNALEEEGLHKKYIEQILNEEIHTTDVLDEIVNKQETNKIAYTKSEYNGWIYVTRINDKELSAAVKPTIIALVLMSLFMLLVTIVIGYISSDYFSKPIRELQTYIPKQPKSKYKDEFEQIGHSIREVVSRNEVLEHTIVNQHEQLKTLFMLNLFRGRLTEAEIVEQLKGFRFPSKWKYLYVMAIQFDSLKKSEFTRKDKDVLLFSINQIVSEVVSENELLPPTVVDSHTQATIFISQTDNFNMHVQNINQYSEEIQKRVNEIFDVTISIGISRPFEQLSDCKQALEQGIESLRYRLKVGKESIIFYETVAPIYSSNQIKTYFPKILENQLFDAIKLGDSEKALTSLHQLFADLYKNNHNPHELEVNIMRFINDIIHLMHVMGMDTLIMDDYKTIYHAISDMKTSEEIEMYVKKNMIYPMIEAITERTDTQYKTISNQILHIIENEYDSDLSLESIATRLHYNKNYLSSIFKKEFQQTFSEYLTLYRYDKAKKWLKETNMSVREISEKLQYRNSQNFIRSFRKIEGITPGKYRDLHRDDSLSF
ncbi:AraC family transcriptional regulator [Metabacillus malikii]|uniref:AraC-like DNA-binding protein n=1 Tax=Metabacillus malikii TaxID=1504265 RepID=A0ABT9ZKE2_9BACI|nr:AraC family transcriptional regulator [Metabacillus malikii]MDQ0232008.1 AraC-like DNA-binding protein [Metabacillus malikii]